jgi:membrane protein implicated in regulation of membrane protease activity
MTAFTVFLGIAGFGFLFLLVSLVFGELFDHLSVDVDHGLGELGHGGPGFFSTRILSVFVTCFGGFGAVASYYEWSLPASIGAGLGGGFTFALLLWLFASYLYKQQASSDVRTSELTGQSARVTVAIPEGGLGQVRCRIGEELVDKVARGVGGAAIGVSTPVKIEESLGEIVIVRPIA